MKPVLAGPASVVAIRAIRGANMGARLSRARKKAKRQAHQASRVKKDAQHEVAPPNRGLRSQKIADRLSLRRAERRPANDR